MSTAKKIFDIVGIFFAVLLSIVLTVILIVAPIISSASSFTKPETIKKIITNINYNSVASGEDYEQPNAKETGWTGNLQFATLNAADGVGFLAADAGLKNTTEQEVQDKVQETLGESGIPSEALEKIMETEAADKIFSLITDEIIAAMTGEGSQELLTSELLISIVEEHIDEIAQIAYDSIEDKNGVSLESLKSSILSEIKTKAPEFTGSIKEFKESIAQSVSTEVVEIVRYSSNGAFTLMLWGSILLVSALVFLCRFSKLKGLIWLGVCFGIGAVSSIIMCFVFDGAVSGLLAGYIAEQEIALVLPMVGVISAEFGKLGLVFLGISLASIGGFVAYRLVMKRKNADNSQTEASAVETVQNEAVAELGNASADDSIATVED